MAQLLFVPPGYTKIINEMQFFEEGELIIIDRVYKTPVTVDYFTEDGLIKQIGLTKDYWNDDGVEI